MSDFSPTDAALEGFRITRERPLAVAIWAAAFLVWGAVQQAVLIGAGLGPMMAQLQASFSNLTPEAQQQLSPTLLKNLPFLLGSTTLSLVFSMVMTTAVLRAVLRPAESRFGFLRLSIDELRQAGLLALIVGAGLAYLFLIAIVTAIVGSISQSVGGAIGVFLNVVLFAATLCGLVYPVVRLSLAPSMTFADGRISLFRSWAMTRGRFWSLLGCYVMALALAFVVFLLSFVIFNLAASLAGRAPPDPASLKSYFTPLAWVALVFNGAISALVSTITVSPMAAAFRQISGGAAAPDVSPAGASPWETH